MDIMFEIVSRQKFSSGIDGTVVFGEAGGIIGRAEECDWVLPDKSKQVSRKHAIVTYYNNTFHIEDISTNGIFNSLGKERLPAATPVAIRHGDGFLIGEYTVSARLMQSAAAYVGEAEERQTLFADSALPLNPLAAMDEEAQREAAARLGNFNDLLGRNTTPTLVPSDHADAPTAHLQELTTHPDEDAPLYDPWDAGKSLAAFATPATFATPARSPEKPAPEQPQGQSPLYPEDAEGPEAVGNNRPGPVASAPETEAFFRTLGYPRPPDTPEERERVLRAAAGILLAAVEGATQAMQNRAECKNELRLSMTTTSLAISNNPLKFSPTAHAALATLLGPSQKGVMDPAEAMRAAFQDIHSHHMGLLAGARAAVGAATRQLSPDTVEAALDANGPVRFFRTRRLWQSFIRLHNRQRQDRESFEALFLQDFARAYEMQCRVLSPAARRGQKGD